MSDALRRWWAHVLAGALVLLAASSYVDFEGYFFIDEAAIYGQLEVLDDGSWTTERPFADEDPDADHVPMALSEVSDEGYAPFAKHPVHVVLARAAHLASGTTGVRLLSSFGTLVAAGAAAALAGPTRPQARWAFWIVLATSPLLFASQLVVAHTLAAGVAGWLAWTVLTRRPSISWLAAAALLSIFGAALRNEFLFFCAAIAAVLVVEVVRRRRAREHLWWALTCTFGALVSYLGEPLVVRALVGSDARVQQRPRAAGDDLATIVAGARRALLDLGGDPGNVVQPLTLVACVASIAIALAIASLRPAEHGLVRFFAVASAVFALAHLFDAHLVRGLLWAFPPVWLLVLVALRKVRPEGGLRTALWITGVFAVAVAVNQYAGGGGPEWGWRYSAIALPVFSVVLAHVLVEARRRIPALSDLAVGAMAASSLLVAASGLVVQRSTVAATAGFLSQSSSVVEDAGVGYVVFADPSFGRFAYHLSVEGSVAAVQPDNSAWLLGRLHERGETSVLLVWRNDAEPPDLPIGPYRMDDERLDLGAGYRGVVLSAT